MPDAFTRSTKAELPPTKAAKRPAFGRKTTIAPKTEGGVDAFQSNNGRCNCCRPSISRGRANVAQFVTAPYVAERCSRFVGSGAPLARKYGTPDTERLISDGDA